MECRNTLYSNMDGVCGYASSNVYRDLDIQMGNQPNARFARLTSLGY